MTREEAIEQLQNCKGLIKQDGKDWLDERDIPLLDMAITALQGGDAKMRNEDFRPSYMQQTPSEDGSDLISRADAIEAVCNAQCELDVPHYPQCDQIKYCDEIKALLALPSADRPQGEWLQEEHKDYKCSVCGAEQWDDTDYCPSCGAYMKGRSE